MLSANYNNSLNGGRIDIKEVRSNTIVKTCYNTTYCTVTVYPYQTGYSSTQYFAEVTLGSVNQLNAIQYSPVIYFNGTSNNQIGSLSLNSDRTTVTSGQTVTLNAHYSGSFPSGGRLVINQSGQGSNPLATTLKTCYTNSCSHTTTLWSYTNGMTYPFVAIVYDASGNMIVWSSPVTVSTNDSTGSTSNDGVNFINGLTLQSDRTSAANGDMVKLTANAYNNGNWSYVGNRIEIRDIRTGSTVRSCYDQSWCVVDLAVTGVNGTAQYEARIYDRNNNFILSQFGPVIYVTGSNNNGGNSGTLTLTADRTSITSGQGVTLTANYSNLNGGRIVIKDMRSYNTVQTCYSSTCTVTVYPTANGYSSIQYVVAVHDSSGFEIATQNGPTIYFNGSNSGSVGQIPNTDIYIAPSTNVRAGGTVYLTASFTNLPYNSANTVIRLYTEQSSTPVGTCSGSVSCSVPYTISTSGVNTRVYGVASNSSLGNTIETARIPLATF